MTTPTRASETRFLLRSPDPAERFVRDGVLAEKEAKPGLRVRGPWRMVYKSSSK